MKKEEEKKDDVKKMSIRPEQVGEAINLLEDAFIWDETKERHDYWEKVRHRLLEIAEKGRRKVCPHCGQIIKKEEAGK